MTKASAAGASLLVALSSACGNWETPESQGTGDVTEAWSCGLEPAPRDAPRGLRVVGNEIQDADGNRVILRGVNRSGSEYQCTKGAGIFDGAVDEESVRVMQCWNVNAVRIPLNEACWLNINGASAEYSGETYQRAILDYVELLQRYGMVPIVELHWAAPGTVKPDWLQPMPNVDHSLDFWADVARTFADNDGVILEPYNEPFPDRNRNTDAAWQCWRDGCTANFSQLSNAPEGTPPTYEAAGMQALVDTIREAGSRHVVLLGGVQFSNGLSRWLEFMPNDPIGQLGAAWHVYDNNACAAESCWDVAPADVVATVPVVVTELGQRDCEGHFVQPLMHWLDAHSTGYLAWSWNAGTQCVGATMDSDGIPWMMITDYAEPDPVSEYARTFRDHLLGFAE